MADVHSSEVRKKNMKAIKNQDTAIEKKVAGLLKSAGFEFNVQVKELPGKPDFSIDSYQVVIFTHGCFWHHHDCYLFKIPATRTGFWLDKIGKNVERDKRDMSHLSESGWRILIIWECALRGRLKLSEKSLQERIEEWVCAGSGHAEISTDGIREKDV